MIFSSFGVAGQENKNVTFITKLMNHWVEWNDGNNLINWNLSICLRTLAEIESYWLGI